jgi:nucleoside-diphosphate-sugar epimerase
VRFTILGSRGFIGRNLVTHLQSCGHEVIGVDTNELNTSKTNLGNIVYSIGLTGDFRSRPFATIEAHISLFSRLFQTLQFDSWTYLSTTRIYSSMAPSHLANEEDEIRVKPCHDSLYDLSKLTGEALCMSSSNPFVRVARLSNVYGIGMSANTFLGSIINGLSIGNSVEIGEARRSAKDYVAVSDVCKSIEFIATRGRNRIYNVASGRNTTHQEIAERLRDVSKTEISFKPQAKLRCFPLIDNTRLLEEFAFEPRNVVQDLEELLVVQNQNNKGGCVI